MGVEEEEEEDATPTASGLSVPVVGGGGGRHFSEAIVIDEIDTGVDVASSKKLSGDHLDREGPGTPLVVENLDLARYLGLADARLVVNVIFILLGWDLCMKFIAILVSLNLLD